MIPSARILLHIHIKTGGGFSRRGWQWWEISVLFHNCVLPASYQMIFIFGSLFGGSFLRRAPKEGFKDKKRAKTHEVEAEQRARLPQPSLPHRRCCSPALCAGKTLHTGAKGAAARGRGSLLTIFTVSKGFFVYIGRCFSPPRSQRGWGAARPAGSRRFRPVLRHKQPALRAPRPRRCGSPAPRPRNPPPFASQHPGEAAPSPAVCVPPRFHHSAPRRPKAADFQGEIKISLCNARC